MAIACIDFACGCPKCNPEYWCIEGERLMEENKSLKAEVDRLQANECVIADERFDMERRLISRAESTEAKLCRALARLNGGGAFPEWVESIREALTIPGSCSHAIVTEKLREVAEDILANGYDQGRRIRLRAALKSVAPKEG